MNVAPLGPPPHVGGYDPASIQVVSLRPETSWHGRDVSYRLHWDHEPVLEVGRDVLIAPSGLPWVQRARRDAPYLEGHG